MTGRSGRVMTQESLSQPDGHVFISYVSEDVERATRLEDELKLAGIRVWRDKTSLRPGEDWKLEIKRAIDNEAFAFIACFSFNSQRREQTHYNEELLLAVERMRLLQPGARWLIPVRFDDCSLPPYDLGAVGP